MLDRIILFALKNRLFVVAAAVLLLIYGVMVILKLPVDVFPDLNRPTVTVGRLRSGKTSTGRWRMTMTP